MKEFCTIGKDEIANAKAFQHAYRSNKKVCNIIWEIPEDTYYLSNNDHIDMIDENNCPELEQDVD